MNNQQGVVLWDKKFSEWATHFPDETNENGNHLIVGHTTGFRRHGSNRNISNPPTVGRKPKLKQWSGKETTI